MADNDFCAESNSDESVLEQLARQIREHREAARRVGLTLLGHLLDAGDALNEAQQRVSTGWKRWLRENCFLSVSTAQLYQQLARNRTEIEEKLRNDPDLSLRAARRLITKRSSNKSTQRTPPPEQPSLTFLTLLALSDEEWRTALEAMPFERFLRIMPPAWRPLLEARAGGQVLSRLKQQQPNVRMKRLKLVHDAGPSPAH
jgi:hypothetical protein